MVISSLYFAHNSRNAEAIPLTFDHKATDSREKKRIREAGGFISNGRVNGTLAVSRSIGDLGMKDFIISRPYTRRTILDSSDEFFLIATDGVS